MPVTTVDGSERRQGPEPAPDGLWSRASTLLVRAIPLVQAALTVFGGVAVIAFFAMGPQGLPLPLFAVALAVPLLFAIAAGVSTLWTYRRTSQGRVLAVVVDYLAFLMVFVLLLHFSGVFIGFDDLADVFGASLPWLVLALVAFVLGYLTDGVSQRPAVKAGVRYIRLILLGIAAVGFLWAIDAVHGAVELLLGLTEPLILVLALASLVLFAFLAALWGTAGRIRFGASLKDSDILDGVLFISPNFLGFLVFFAGPLLFSLYVSLTDWDAFSDPIFLGVQNYLDILAIQVLVLDDPSVLLPPGLEQGFSEIARIGSIVIAAQDKLFWISLRNILVFCLIAIPMAVIPALFLASLLNARVRGIRMFRAIYFIPSVAGIVGVAIIWRQLLDQTVGWINYGITIVVDTVNSTFGLAIEDPNIGWLSDPVTALPVIAVVFAWTTVGFNSVLFLAGLQGVPADLYEAATIDGANRWQRFRNITLPSVSATTFFVVATTTILAMQLFTEPFVLKGLDPGGPNNATLTPVMYLYESGFQNFEFGYASAIAWVLFGLIFIFTIVQYRRQRAEAFGD
jgi:ABC-type sugar transport system permease subunit